MAKTISSRNKEGLQRIILNRDRIIFISSCLVFPPNKFTHHSPPPPPKAQVWPCEKYDRKKKKRESGFSNWRADNKERANPSNRSAFGRGRGVNRRRQVLHLFLKMNKKREEREREKIEDNFGGADDIDTQHNTL
jgi:hypothetical protein